jgi:hypothetical protein
MRLPMLRTGPAWVRGHRAHAAGSAAQKPAESLGFGIVIVAVPLASVVAAQPAVHRNLANAPRKRKPHVSYPVRDLF